MVRLVPLSAPRSATALELGSELRTFNYRDSSTLSGRVVDDTPYGGGAGMVLRVDIVDQALTDAYGSERPGRRILLAPSGRQLDDGLATELAERGAPRVAVRALRGRRPPRP